MLLSDPVLLPQLSDPVLLSNPVLLSELSDPIPINSPADRELLFLLFDSFLLSPLSEPVLSLLLDPVLLSFPPGSVFAVFSSPV